MTKKGGDSTIIIVIIIVACLIFSSIAGGLVWFFREDIFGTEDSESPSPGPSKTPGPRAPGGTPPGPRAPGGTPTVGGGTPTAGGGGTPTVGGGTPTAGGGGTPTSGGGTPGPSGKKGTCASAPSSSIASYSKYTGVDQDTATIGRGSQISANNPKMCTDKCDRDPRCVGVSIFNENDCIDATYTGFTNPICYLLSSVNSPEIDKNYNIYMKNNGSIPPATAAK